jgi:hypothetical protein
MNININNWEAYAVDFFDGTLSAAEQDEFLAFIDSHPGIKEEFLAYEQEVTIAPEKIVFQEKQELKRREILPYGKINENNFEEYIVLYIDGELTEAEKEEFHAFTGKNPFLEKEIELIKATRIIPDKSIVFEEKNSIKRNYKILPLARWSAVAAIFIAGLFLITPYFSNRGSHSRRQVASVKRLPALHRNKLTRDYDNPATILPVQKFYVAATKQKETLRLPGPLPEPMKNIKRGNKLLLSTVNNDGVINNGYYASRHSGILSSGKKKRKNKTLFMKIVSKSVKKAGALLANRKQKQKNNKYKEPAAIKIIDNGIKVLNKITGDNVIVAKVYDKGNLKNYQLIGNNWEIKRKFGRR